MNTITIRKKLDSDIIVLGSRAKALLGKQVEVVVREIPQSVATRKQWHQLGKINLHKKADTLHIRNFAYDE